MKNANRMVSRKIKNQTIRHLKTVYLEIMAMIHVNFKAITSLQKRTKAGLILSFLVSFNGMFASNHGKEIRPNNGLIAISAPQLPYSNQSNSYKVPFILRHNLIFIEAIVDGKEGLLMLDTGMDKLILNQNHFRGKTTSDYISGVIDDMGNSHRKQVSVQIGNLPKHTQHAFISYLDHLEQSLQMDILGICGVDFLQQFQWVIHYHQRFIAFFPLSQSGQPLVEPSLPTPGKIISLEKEGGHLSVLVRVGKSPMNLVLDTGTNSLVMDKKHKSYLANQGNYLEELRHETNAIGINGSKETINTFILTDLSIGNTELPPMQVSFFSLKKINRGRYRKFDGIFNPLFLCRGTIGINWKKKQLYIWEPHSKPEYSLTEKRELLADVR